MRQDLHRIAKAKAESLESVRARVLELIKGKKIVGYHLPQKLADFGILTMVASSSAQKSPEKPVAKAPVQKSDSDSDSPKLRVPNKMTKAEIEAPMSKPQEKPKPAVSIIEEAYDCAKIFNTTMTGNQMPIGTLCDTYLNVIYKKKNGPAFAVSDPKV